MRKQREENIMMASEERVKMSFDVQDSKDKIDLLKRNLYDAKKVISKLEGF
jgi:hypothetical protein